MLTVKVKRMGPNAIVPDAPRPGDAGIDLYCAYDVVIQPHTGAIVETDVAFEIPPGHVGIVKDRSGVASKRGLHVVAGVIDSSYRGEVGVVMRNLSDNGPQTITQGTKIAQLLVIPTPEVVLEEVTELGDTARGAAGYGSTGT